MRCWKQFLVAQWVDCKAGGALTQLHSEWIHWIRVSLHEADVAVLEAILTQLRNDRGSVVGGKDCGAGSNSDSVAQ